MIEDLSDLGFHARLYALAGIKVFPLYGIVGGPGGLRCSCREGLKCTSPGKHPRFKPAHTKEWTLANGKCYGRCGQRGHGLYDATDDVATIAEWWTEDPRCGIGMPAHGNGYRILDVDPKSGGNESFAKLHAYVLDRTGTDLMATLIQNTGRHDGERGMHLLFGGAGDGISSKPKAFGPDMPGLDTRGVGGYIVTWPTLHISGVEYEYIDWRQDPSEWPAILTVLMNPPKPVRAPTTSSRRREKGAAYGEKALSAELDDVLNTGEGTRNHRLNLAAFNMGQLVADGTLSDQTVRDELLNAAMRAGLNYGESLRTIESGVTAGISKPRRTRAA